MAIQSASKRNLDISLPEIGGYTFLKFLITKKVKIWLKHFSNRNMSRLYFSHGNLMHNFTLKKFPWPNFECIWPSISSHRANEVDFLLYFHYYWNPYSKMHAFPWNSLDTLIFNRISRKYPQKSTSLACGERIDGQLFSIFCHKNGFTVKLCVQFP